MIPQPKNKKDLKRLPSVEDMAKQRFGDVEGLAVVQKTTVELSKHYAGRFDLDPQDPEVSIIASALAFTRHQELLLLTEVERALFARVADHPAGLSYGEVLFNVTRTGAYKDISREIDRLHSRAAVYMRELGELQSAARQNLEA